MEYRQLGKSGLQVSAIGLGTNTFGRAVDAEQAAAIVHRALDLGINFIDTADIYGRGVSEEYIGRALKGRRQEAVVATKVAGPMGDGPNMRGASRQHIIDGLHASLRLLDTDYVDLYQVHFVDPNTPIEETMRALDDMVRSGLVRYIGCSNFMAWQVCEAQWAARAHHLTPFVSVQPQYNIISRAIEHELVPFCQAYGVGIIPYSPLAGGFLTGKYRPGEAPPEGTRYHNSPFADRILTERNFQQLQRLEAFASARGRSVGDLAIAWLLARPMVSTVIIGATKPEQVETNVKSGEWQLTAEEMKELDEITK